METKTLNQKQKAKLTERLDDVLLAEMIERRFDGPFVSARDILKEIDQRKEAGR